MKSHVVCDASQALAVFSSGQPGKAWVATRVAPILVVTGAFSQIGNYTWGVQLQMYSLPVGTFLWSAEGRLCFQRILTLPG